MGKSPDRVKQVKTTLERHGADFYSKIGTKGGKSHNTNTSEKGTMAANIRWERYREQQAKLRKEES